MSTAMSPNRSGDSGFQSACTHHLPPKESNDEVGVQEKLSYDHFEKGLNKTNLVQLVKHLLEV